MTGTAAAATTQPQVAVPGTPEPQGCPPDKSAAMGLDRQFVEVLPRLLLYALKLTHDTVTAEDLVQEALARGIEKIHLWRPGTDLRAWLFTILHNLYVNGVRRAVRDGLVVALTDGEPPLVRRPDQDDRLRLRDLQRALQQLPEEQRSVVVLVGLNGDPYETIAAFLDIPIGTVRSRLSRGRKALRELTDGIASPTLPRSAARFRRCVSEQER
jgi:RNA polymerase sigma-70 factor, ECF subfamily